MLQQLSFLNMVYLKRLLGIALISGVLRIVLPQYVVFDGRPA